SAARVWEGFDDALIRDDAENDITVVRVVQNPWRAIARQSFKDSILVLSVVLIPSHARGDSRHRYQTMTRRRPAGEKIWRLRSRGPLHYFTRSYSALPVR